MADYHGMWQGLGMDLETHDKLCDALPVLFGETFLEQENRPAGMDYYNMVIAEVHGLRIAELLAHKEQGGRAVGSFCIYVPEEIVLALDGILVGLCAGSQFWVPAGEAVLPRNLCALVKAGLGAQLSKTCPYFQSVDLIVGENTCDGKKKAWEILGDYAPLYVMDMPNRKSPAGFALFREELGALARRLEELTGRTLTAEGLLRGCELVDRKRRVLDRLYALRKADPVPLSGRDALLVSQIAFYDDPERFIAQTEALAAECEARASRGEGVFPKGAPRILVTGTPIVVPNWKFHTIAETSGLAVVVEENCTGTRYFEQKVTLPETKDVPSLLDALAHRYFDGINCACFSPNEGRFDDVVRLAREYRADGVVNLSLSFCTTYQVEEERLRKRLAAEGIPFLSLETDYAPGDEEQLKTRIEAFGESLRR
ncbi:double-cubane-cluster-containing anaerobic reductase [Aminiphilus sp.]|uniref:double-cubane-cluster-containing anaerobic reductase n=1 Tax=Aminiphilus sp. TaxID=1872488 RepID=UPI0026375688|nr:double-cubane-cluster-containing anaerobic reductase [Aminiphilus sp.]